MQQQGFDIMKLEQEVKTRWLKPKEILQILQNHELFTVAQKTPHKPPSGSWFLFNRRVLRYFRNDGYEWRKKKNGKTIAEAHERLKVDNVEALNCYYAHADENRTFQRRIYWMLEPAYEHIVLVHYRDVLEGSISVSAMNDPSTSNQNGSASRAEGPSSPGLTSELIAPCLNSYSPGSAEEVSSQNVTINNETTNTIQYQAALQKLKMQLSLEDRDRHDSGTEEVLPNNESILVHGIQNEEPDTCRNLGDVFNGLEFSEDDYIEGSHPYPNAIDALKNSGAQDRHDGGTEEVLPINEPILVQGIQNEEPDTCRNLGDVFNGLDFSGDDYIEGSHPYPNAIDVLKNSDTWLEEDQLESLLDSASMTVNENQWFRIHEVSPEWAFCSESTKVVITGDFLCSPSQSILFGDVKVPVEAVQQGVIRCYTPCLGAGKVRMCFIDENGNPCSEAREFEFREKPTKYMIDGNGKPCSGAQEFEIPQKPTKSSDELLLLLNHVQMLFDGRCCELFSKFRLPVPDLECGFQVNPTEVINIPINKTCKQLDREQTVDCVLEVLLNNKFENWLSSKCEQNSEGHFFLPKQYHGVIHTSAALGYYWALKPLLNSGVPINYRDANGWTALHWAARFGRETMVVELLDAGAAAGALSDPTSEDPAAKTPASIASAYGFKGLSAFLSEAELRGHLHSLESKENGNCIDHTSREGTSSAVTRISDKCAHVHEGTDDQLALKDSLGAIRYAVQAAGRIQAAFRVFSFKKKREIALQNSDSYVLSTREASAASRAMLEKAALSIQKNFRCWKKRKEFLRIRKNVIKIQARVRAHQERNKYKELLRSVNILEKVMLRWFKKGVGLRGFSSGAMPIDQDDEEDIVRAFRKERVEAAVNEAVSRVSSIVGCPIARQDYRRILEIHRQAKHNVGKEQSC